MGKAISIGQSHQVMSVLANNVDWTKLDPEMLQEFIDNPKMAGSMFEKFLKDGSMDLNLSLSVKVDLIEDCNFTKKSERYSLGLFESKGTGRRGLEGKAISLGEVSTESALEKISDRGKRPMVFMEALQWFKNNPNAEGWFVALGAVCSLRENGSDISCVLVLHRDDSERGLHVYRQDVIGGWTKHFKFLVVDKESKKQNK